MFYFLTMKYLSPEIKASSLKCHINELLEITVPSIKSSIYNIGINESGFNEHL